MYIHALVSSNQVRAIFVPTDDDSSLTIRLVIVRDDWKI